MRFRNALIAISPLLAALALTWLFGLGGWSSVIAYLVLLDVVVSLISTALFVVYWRDESNYEKLVLSRATKPRSPPCSCKIAVLIPSFNEPPRIVAETVVASKAAVGSLGDVYVLDDSTNATIREEIDRYSSELGFQVVRRDNRKGYKAGAINSWLHNHGSEYDYVAIADADQRLIPGVFEHVMQFFDDPRVAFVQVPQYYSGLDTTVALSAYIQQMPFLRVTLRGRQQRGTAFSLGSGTTYRVKDLLSVGGLDERTVTEDISTSVTLHEKGRESVYVDLPLVWSGEAPKDLPSYISQQNRWALGGFQLVKKLLSANLSASKLTDYFNGVYYWLHVGLLKIADIAAPALFLLLGVYFMRINPLAYLAVYVPIFVASIAFFLKVMLRYRYGTREFLYHQGIEMLASLPVTLALFEWLLGKKKSFKVTPKGAHESRLTRYHLYYGFTVGVLALSVLVGSFKMMTQSGSLYYAYLVNLFWAALWLTISAFGFYVSLSLPAPKRLAEAIGQTYEGLQQQTAEALDCAIRLENAIADHYMRLSSRVGKYSEPLKIIAEDSYRHAKIYARFLDAFRQAKSLERSSCDWIKPHLDQIASAKEIEDVSKQLFISEEILMDVYAKLLLETLKGVLPDLENVKQIGRDEEMHESVIRQIIKEIKPSSN